MISSCYRIYTLKNDARYRRTQYYRSPKYGCAKARSVSVASNIMSLKYSELDVIKCDMRMIDRVIVYLKHTLT